MSFDPTVRDTMIADRLRDGAILLAKNAEKLDRLDRERLNSALMLVERVIDRALLRPGHLTVDAITSTDA